MKKLFVNMLKNVCFFQSHFQDSFRQTQGCDVGKKLQGKPLYLICNVEEKRMISFIEGKQHCSAPLKYSSH